MARSAEMLWIDVLEHEESGEREEALELARHITRLDPAHAAAWQLSLIHISAPTRPY